MSADNLFLPALKTASRKPGALARSFCFVLAALLATSCVSAETIELDGHELHVKLAVTQAEQNRGLQGVTSLSDREGVLFIFEPPRAVCMWMHRVPIDLDVGFFDKNKRLLAIFNMKAQTKTTHCSPLAAAFALETRAGWFKDHQVGIGARLSREGDAR